MNKKILSITCVALTLCLTACTTYNDSEEVDGVFFGYSKLFNNCFVGGVSYSKGEDTNIVLPSTYNGYTINELGGYIGTGFPCPFGVFFEGEDWFPEPVSETYTTLEEYLYDDFFEGETLIVEDIFFHITLPSGLETVKNLACDDIFYGEAVKDGQTIVYVLRPVYYFVITKENKYFYTDNGILYEKGTSKRIERVVYTPYSSGNG